MVLFIVGNLIILVLVLFENIFLDRCFKLKLGEIEAISDDYYKEISFQSLLNEYERLKDY